MIEVWPFQLSNLNSSGDSLYIRGLASRLTPNLVLLAKISVSLSGLIVRK